jgi:DNA-binding NarL/FixJ family response regulator
VAANSLDRLNDRQKDVLFLVRKGFRNAEIANHVGLSPRSVKGYVSQLLLIYDVSNRTELAGLFGGQYSASAADGG